MSRAIVIPVEGEPQVIDIDLNGTQALSTLIGGWIENVTVSREAAMYLDEPQRGLALLVDEEGLLKHKPINHNATPFYCADPTLGIIAGDAVLVGQDFDPMEGWDWTDLPEDITPQKVIDAGVWAVKMAGRV